MMAPSLQRTRAWLASKSDARHEASASPGEPASPALSLAQSIAAGILLPLLLPWHAPHAPCAPHRSIEAPHTLASHPDRALEFVDIDLTLTLSISWHPTGARAQASPFALPLPEQQQAEMEEDMGAAGGPSKYVKLIR